MGVVAIIGLVALVLAFAYGVMRVSGRTRRDKQVTRAATNAEYEGDGRGPSRG